MEAFESLILENDKLRNEGEKQMTSVIQENQRLRKQIDELKYLAQNAIRLFWDWEQGNDEMQNGKNWESAVHAVDALEEFTEQMEDDTIIQDE